MLLSRRTGRLVGIVVVLGTIELIASYAYSQPLPGTKAIAQNEGSTVSEADTPISLESSLSLRDPFRRPKLRGRGQDDEGGNVPELERFALEEFSLVGVITGTKKNKALLSLPSGKMVIVQEKTILGPRRGSITRIVPGAVFIEERVVNLLGQEEKIETIIEFKEKKNSEQRANL